MFLKNLFNRKKLSSDIEESLKEIQRQLSQGGGYPFSKAQLRGALQNIAQGNFLGVEGLDPRFEHVFTTEPVIIPSFSYEKFLESDNEKVEYSSFNNGYFSDNFSKPSNPLEVGSKKQFTLYKIKIDSTNYHDQCVKFVKYMGGNFPNLRGLMTAYQLIGDMFPKKYVRDDGSAVGSKIWGLDQKENCDFSEGGFMSGPHFSVMALNFNVYLDRFEFMVSALDGSWYPPSKFGNEYLLFYYDCD